MEPFYIPTDLSKQHGCQQQGDWINRSAADHFCQPLFERHACFVLFFTINQLEGYIAVIGSLLGRITKGNLKSCLSTDLLTTSVTTMNLLEGKNIIFEDTMEY